MRTVESGMVLRYAAAQRACCCCWWSTCPPGCRSCCFNLGGGPGRVWFLRVNLYLYLFTSRCCWKYNNINIFLFYWNLITCLYNIFLIEIALQKQLWIIFKNKIKNKNLNFFEISSAKKWHFFKYLPPVSVPSVGSCAGALLNGVWKTSWWGCMTSCWWWSMTSLLYLQLHPRHLHVPVVLSDRTFFLSSRSWPFEVSAVALTVFLLFSAVQRNIYTIIITCTSKIHIRIETASNRHSTHHNFRCTFLLM